MSELLSLFCLLPWLIDKGTDLERHCTSVSVVVKGNCFDCQVSGKIFLLFHM